MEFRSLFFLLFAIAVAVVECNSEGDVLHAWKTQLTDPYNVLESWDPTLVNPCTWFHVTCNNDNAVIRVDLGQSGLSGPIVPQLGNLTHLQYLEIFSHKFTGSIPAAIGKLTNLISLGLQHNMLSGSIPSSLGNLRNLKFMRLNGNRLSGTIPKKIFELVDWGNLSVMNVSDNRLVGTIKSFNATGFAVTTIIQDPRAPK